MRARRDEEVLAVGRLQHVVEPLAAAAVELQSPATRHDSVHREAASPEVVARRVEDHEVKTGGGGLLHAVAGRIGTPEEWVVERVEVGAMRDRRALLVEDAVGAEDVVLEA